SLSRHDAEPAPADAALHTPRAASDGLLLPPARRRCRVALRLARHYSAYRDADVSRSHRGWPDGRRHGCDDGHLQLATGARRVRDDRAIRAAAGDTVPAVEGSLGRPDRLRR